MGRVACRGGEETEQGYYIGKLVYAVDEFSMDFQYELYRINSLMWSLYTLHIHFKWIIITYTLLCDHYMSLYHIVCPGYSLSRTR